MDALNSWLQGHEWLLWGLVIWLVYCGECVRRYVSDKRKEAEAVKRTLRAGAGLDHLE